MNDFWEDWFSNQNTGQIVLMLLTVYFPLITLSSYLRSEGDHLMSISCPILKYYSS